MKVDFTKIPVENIEGNVEKIDLSKSVGNRIYNECNDIAEADLARSIYREGTVDITREQVDIVRKYIAGWPFVLRSSIEAALKEPPAENR